MKSRRRIIFSKPKTTPLSKQQFTTSDMGRNGQFAQQQFGAAVVADGSNATGWVRTEAGLMSAPLRERRSMDDAFRREERVEDERIAPSV